MADPSHLRCFALQRSKKLKYDNAVQGCVDAAEAEGLDEFGMDMSDPEGFCDEFGDYETDEGWACLADGWGIATGCVFGELAGSWPRPQRQIAAGDSCNSCRVPPPL